jgi:hypothetical protein
LGQRGEQLLHGLAQGHRGRVGASARFGQPERRWSRAERRRQRGEPVFRRAGGHPGRMHGRAAGCRGRGQAPARQRRRAVPGANPGFDVCRLLVVRRSVRRL